MLVEGKDKLGNLKLRICLDPTNLSKAIVREPYQFKTSEDIVHLLVDACIMTVCDCKKGYRHQQLDEASSFLTSFNTDLGRFRYTLMPFGVTVAGDVVFWEDQASDCDSWLHYDCWQKQKHSNHDQTLTTLLKTARRCNVRLNYEKLQYKKQEVDFWWDLNHHWLQAWSKWCSSDY